MNTITFHFLISLTIFEGLDMRLMDVIIAYLYGSIDNDIYMKIPKGFKFVTPQILGVPLTSRQPAEVLP